MKTLEQVQLETEMAIRAKNGDEDAFMFLVKQYEEMIYKFVHKFHYLKLNDKDDIYSLGLIGIHLAVQEFDPSKASFGTLVFYWIRHEIQSKTKREWYKFNDKQTDSIDNEDYSAEIGLALVDKSEDVYNQLATKLDNEFITEIMRKNLTKKQFEIMYPLIILGYTNTDVAEQLYVSRTTVGTVKSKCLKKLKDVYVKSGNQWV